MLEQWKGFSVWVGMVYGHVTGWVGRDTTVRTAEMRDDMFFFEKFEHVFRRSRS